MNFKQIPIEKNYEISPDGIIRNIKTKKIKSQYIGSTGYYMITISHNNKSKPHRVHRLLMITYKENPKNYKEINHIDGNKLNNSIDNLEWCDHLANMKHAFMMGLANNTGEKNGRAKLRSENIPVIRKLLNDGLSQYKIAKIFNVSRSTIMNIKNRGQWKHV